MIKTLEEVQTKSCFAKNWIVYIYNDNTTPIDFVIEVLISIFEYNSHKAIRLTYEVNDKVYGIVGKYPEKLAKSRVKRAMDFVHSKGYTDFKMEAKMED